MAAGMRSAGVLGPVSPATGSDPEEGSALSCCPSGRIHFEGLRHNDMR